MHRTGRRQAGFPDMKKPASLKPTPCPVATGHPPWQGDNGDNVSFPLSTRPSPLGFLLRSGYGGQDGGQERGKAKQGFLNCRRK
ncbi:MAG: hypothetical protein ABIE14_00520 [Patescibacteria group bacterium]